MDNFQNKEVRVYIASPYTNGWMPKMVKLQIETTNALMNEGYFPYAPLLCHFQEIFSARTEHEWLQLDFVWLKQCDAVLRLRPVDNDGKEIYSSGADKETSLAEECGIPVFESMEKLNDHFKANATQTKITVCYADSE